MRNTLLVTALLTGLLTPLVSFAQATLNLDAKATSSVPSDEAVVVIFSEKSGADSKLLNEQVFASLSTLLKEVKNKPAIKWQMGSLSTNANSFEKNRPVTWRVHGDLTLYSKDRPTLMALIGSLPSSLQIGQLSYRLSDAERTIEESKLLQTATTSFKLKAEEAAKAMGYAGYSLKELTINNQGDSPGPRGMMMVSKMSSDGAESLLTSGDLMDVKVTLTGSVFLK